MKKILKNILLLSLLYFNSHALAEEKKKPTNKKTKELRWLSKTDQFVIYQERKINKAKKQFVYLDVGKHKLNGVSENRDFGFNYRYYVSESTGFGAYFTITASSIHSDIEQRTDSELIFANQTKFQYGIAYDWVPLYGKHLYGRDVFYSDIGMSFTLGLTSAENNSTAIQNNDSTQALDSTSSLDIGVEPFFRFFIQDKYFFKFGYRFRSTSLQEANDIGKSSPGAGRTFVSNAVFSFGTKF